MQRKMKAPHSIYGPDELDFGISRRRKQVQWISCRDEFQWAFTNQTGFFYHGTRRQLRNGTSFARKIQEVMKLPRKDRLKFRKTTDPKVIYIQLSDFWRAKVRRSFLTMILRAGAEHYIPEKKNWRQVLRRDYYCSATLKATQRFMNGYTGIRIVPRNTAWGDSEGFDGWVDYFSSANNKRKLNQILVKRGEKWISKSASKKK